MYSKYTMYFIAGVREEGGSWVLLRVASEQVEYFKFMKCDLFSGLAWLKMNPLLIIIFLAVTVEENISERLTRQKLKLRVHVHTIMTKCFARKERR